MSLMVTFPIGLAGGVPIPSDKYHLLPNFAVEAGRLIQAGHSHQLRGLLDDIGIPAKHHKMAVIQFGIALQFESQELIDSGKIECAIDFIGDSSFSPATSSAVVLHSPVKQPPSPQVLALRLWINVAKKNLGTGAEVDIRDSLQSISLLMRIEAAGDASGDLQKVSGQLESSLTSPSLNDSLNVVEGIASHEEMSKKIMRVVGFKLQSQADAFLAGSVMGGTRARTGASFLKLWWLKSDSEALYRLAQGGDRRALMLRIDLLLKRGDHSRLAGLVMIGDAETKQRAMAGLVKIACEHAKWAKYGSPWSDRFSRVVKEIQRIGLTGDVDAGRQAVEGLIRIATPIMMSPESYGDWVANGMWNTLAHLARSRPDLPVIPIIVDQAPEDWAWFEKLGGLPSDHPFFDVATIFHLVQRARRVKSGAAMALLDSLVRSQHSLASFIKGELGRLQGEISPTPAGQ